MEIYLRIILFFAAGVAFVSLSACSTIRSAREAQKSLISQRSESRISDLKRLEMFSDASLPVLFSFAITNEPSVLAAGLAVKDARLAMKEIEADAPLASSTPWGALDANASVSYGEASRATRFSDLKMKTLRSDPSASLSINLLFYDFGRNESQKREQAEIILANEQSLAERGFEVFLNVANSYFALHESDALFAVAKTNVVMACEHLHDAEKRFEEGLVQPLDVLRARLDLANAKEKLVSSSNDVIVAGANLMSSLGLEATDGAEKLFLGMRDGALDVPSAIIPQTTNSCETLFSFALTNAPAVSVARARLRAAGARVDRAIADLKPNLSAGVSLNWADPLWYWRWGVDVIQSLFTGCRKTTAVDRAVVALETAGVNLESTEQELSAALARAHAKRENAAKAEAAALESFVHARENLDLVREKVALGDASRIDLTDATSAYVKSLASRITAFYQGQKAEAEIISLIGRLPF